MPASDINQTDRAAAWFADFQLRLAAAAGALGGDKFRRSEWRGKLGTGAGLVCEGGKIFERGAVNFSRVAGNKLPPAAQAARVRAVRKKAGDDNQDSPFEAAGVSAIFHPRNPHCPAAHLNLRFFSSGGRWWFGGGMDLTPYYPVDADCRAFHAACKTALDAFGKRHYPKFKRRCDEYFYLPHRDEMRGIGGVFFDDFCEGGFTRAFALAQAVGGAFLSVYPAIVKKRKAKPYARRHRRFQLWRRGRYAEFNLLYDRGTLFGLQSGGRAESILVSLPPLTAWRYNYSPRGEEEKRLAAYLQPRDWVK